MYPHIYLKIQQFYNNHKNNNHYDINWKEKKTCLNIPENRILRYKYFEANTNLVFCGLPDTNRKRLIIYYPSFRKENYNFPNLLPKASEYYTMKLWPYLSFLAFLTWQSRSGLWAMKCLQAASQHRLHALTTIQVLFRGIFRILKHL